MFTYLEAVVINDGFYNNVIAIVLDKRLYNGEAQYLLDLKPARWLPERKLRKHIEACEETSV